MYLSESRGRYQVSPAFVSSDLTSMTYRVRSLALDGDHQDAFTIRDDLFSDLGGLGSEVGTSNHTKLNLSINDESETDCELLMSDETGCSVDYNVSPRSYP